MWNRLWNRRRLDEEARAEFETHLELLTDRYIGPGMTTEEAQRAARRQLGNTLLVREELHQMNGFGWLQDLVVDVRLGLRLLRRNRGFALVAILTLALGVGATTVRWAVRYSRFRATTWSPSSDGAATMGNSLRCRVRPARRGCSAPSHPAVAPTPTHRRPATSVRCDRALNWSCAAAVVAIVIRTEIVTRIAETIQATGRRGAGIACGGLGDLRPMLLMLLGAVAFVLAIACANVANLMLARGAAREGELAVRRSLGARDSRIVRQLLTESVVLFVLGGAAGLLVALWTVDLLVAMSPAAFPDFVRIGVDWRVLAVTLTACLAGGLLSGIAPAIAARRAASLAPVTTMGRDGGARSTTLRRGLVTAEIALAVVLLASAGLMVRTLDQLMAVDPGFRPRGLVTLRLMARDVSVPARRRPSG